MTELWVKDKHGQARDIILGYDDNVRTSADLYIYFYCTILVAVYLIIVRGLSSSRRHNQTQLLTDPAHPVFNPIVGR